MSFKIVIPARYGSTRLSGKALRLIAGKPMVQHVCERALLAGAESVVVATDDQRIVDAVVATGVTAVLTSATHRSGTERIVETAEILGWKDHDLVVNVQGDEPLIDPALIGKVAEALMSNANSSVATLAAPITDQKTLFNPNVVKVVLNELQQALYFSRAPIPWDRDNFAGFLAERREGPLVTAQYWRHIGIYGYSVGFLKRYVNWSVSPLETVESLEQLRILWHGESLSVVRVAEAPHEGVDTLADLERVEAILQAEKN